MLARQGRPRGRTPSLALKDVLGIRGRTSSVIRPSSSPSQARELSTTAKVEQSEQFDQSRAILDGSRGPDAPGERGRSVPAIGLGVRTVADTAVAAILEAEFRCMKRGVGELTAGIATCGRREPQYQEQSGTKKSSVTRESERA